MQERSEHRLPPQNLEAEMSVLGGVLLENEAQIAALAKQIFLHAGITNAMPPANASFMEEAERQKIADWYRSVVKPFSFGS